MEGNRFGELVSRIERGESADRLAAAAQLFPDRIGPETDPDQLRWELRRDGGWLPYVPDLVELLDSWHRVTAANILRDLDPNGIERLRRARRTASSARVRRAALRVLDEADGYATLDDVDRANVHRLIRILQTREQPAPLSGTSGWFAVRTAQIPALLEVLDLSDPIPATMPVARLAREHRWPHRVADPPCAATDGGCPSRDLDGVCRHSTDICTYAYVTPRLNGWTVVHGDLPPYHHPWAPFLTMLTVHPHDRESPDYRQWVLERCTMLSRRFGAAQWFQRDPDVWCIARNGEVLHYYDDLEPEAAIGRPQVEESFDRLAERFASAEPRRRKRTPARATNRLWVAGEHGHDACSVAAELSVDPTALDGTVKAAGTGMFVRTECGRRHGVPDFMVEAGRSAPVPPAYGARSERR